MNKHLKIFSFIVPAIAAIALTGCQQLNSGLAKINHELGSINGTAPNSSSSLQSASGPSVAKTQWSVTHEQAMAWLAHDEPTWDDNGALKGVNWFKFWSAQVHEKSSLAQDAYQYCHEDTWSQRKVGSNCEGFWQAYSMTKSDESIKEGNEVVQKS